MTSQEQVDPEHFELRLPLWAVTDTQGLHKRGLPYALREFVDDVHGGFLDLFTQEDIAAGYIRKAGFTNWQAVALTTAEQLRAAVVAFEQRGCNCIGLDCTGRDKSGQF